jgi:hypothetical protein
MPKATHVFLTPENGEEPTAVAIVQPMHDGDLLVGVRAKGEHPDNERAIVTIAVLDDGSVRVRVMKGDASNVGEFVV